MASRTLAWRTVGLIALMLAALATAKARAADCPGNPDAIGTSRVISIEPRQFPRIGLEQYRQTLPLDDKEVVLTFDDGPLPPYTNRILDVLAENCVKANYFLVGRMARGYPELARRIRSEGHTIGTHSENHLLGFDHAPMDTVKYEIEQGIVSVGAALGSSRAVSPFFRIPGFLRRTEVEAYLQSRRLTTWSADLVADDWRHINASEVVRRAITRLDEKGKGILLLHDIQPATALALPELLRELKERGYRIVQVVPGRGGNGMPMASAAPLRRQQSEPLPLAAFVPRKVEPIRAEPVVEATSEPAAPASAPALSAEAAGSMARATPDPDATLPLTSDARPSRNVTTPEKSGP